MNKKMFVRYDSTADFESSEGVIRIYVREKNGYVNYNFTHTVRKDANADVWRLGQAFYRNESLEGEYPLTRCGAEWDMAVHLDGRDDFIGGFNHGDEIYYSFALFVDGALTELSAIGDARDFSEIRIVTDSVGYDPSDHISKVLLHHKEYTVNKNGVRLDQSVRFLGNYGIGPSYLAMMPPLKVLTDGYYTDISPEAMDITFGKQERNVRSATVFGKESGLYYTMSIPAYPEYENGGIFMITDNNNSPYNKMYFYVCKKAEVHAGVVWKSVTEYRIEEK